jgi:hypothetical protein
VQGFPNAKAVALHRPSWDILVVRDVAPPPPVRAEFQEMVRERLAQMAQHADEWMRTSTQGDGHPNLPLWLTLPWCVSDDDDDGGGGGGGSGGQRRPPQQEQEGVPRGRRLPRLLISFKETDPQLEIMRMQAAIFAQCC